MSFLDIFKREPVRVADDSEAKALRAKQYQELKKYFTDETVKIIYKEYAIQLAINRLANAVLKSRFDTYEKGKPTRSKIWYQLNYEPNVNDNASEFWGKVIERMVNGDDGALVVQLRDGQLLVADSFVVKKRVSKPNIYSGIVVNDFAFDSVFTEDQVWHLEMNNSKMRGLLDRLYADYGKLLGGSIQNFNRNSALKLILKIDSSFDQFRTKTVEKEDGTQVDEYDFIIDDIFEKRLAPLFSGDDSATPLEAGLSIEALGSEKLKGYDVRAINTRDIKASFDDIVNIVADAFSIPRGILKGDTADAGQMTDNFIAFAVNPLVEIIESEVNRKMYGFKNVSARTYLRVNTDGIRNYDLAKLATSAELMARIGAMSVNDILQLLSREPIDKEWADKHVISKNYALVEDNLKGGEMNEETGTQTDPGESETAGDGDS